MQGISGALAEKITNLCSKENQNSETESVIIQYGLELIIENFIKTVLLFIIACVTDTVFETLIVIGVFSTLRCFAGGIHMKTSIGCSMSMIFIWMTGVFGCRVLIVDKWISLILFILCISGFYLFSPCDTKNNPITNIKIRKKKKYQAVTAAVIYTAIALISGNDNIRMLILIPMMLEVITIVPIVNYINQKRFKEE